MKEVEAQECKPDDKIEGFPTVRLYKGDQYVQYQGNRTLEDLIDFCMKNK